MVASYSLKQKQDQAIIADIIHESNYYRIRFFSLVVLGFSLFNLVADYFIAGIWHQDHLSQYKILDIILLCLSIIAVTFFWVNKNDKTSFSKLSFRVYLLLSIIWFGYLSGIDFENVGYISFIFAIITVVLVFYNSTVFSLYFYLAGTVALSVSLAINEQNMVANLDKVIIIIPIIFISFLLGRRNYLNKVNDLQQKMELNRLNSALSEAKENLEQEVDKQTKNLSIALEELSSHQEELKQANFRFSSLVNNLQSGVFYINTKGDILEANPAILKILGSPSKEKTMAINIFSFKPLIDIGYTGKLKECINKKEIISGEATYVSLWGKKAIVNFYFVPIINEGEVVGVLSSNEDVTKEREYEEKLAEKTDALSRQNEEFEALNEELMQTNNDLFEAKEKAEESDRLKTVFLNNMSHEIRTPLNGIVGFSGILDKPDLSTEKRNSFIRIIKNSSDQLLRIIDDILEISVLETKQVPVVREEFFIKDLMMELFSIFQMRAKDRRIDLRISYGVKEGNCKMYSDKSKLHKILSNLIENSLKYTQEGFVEIGCEKKAGQLKLFVKDSGIGIDPKSHDEIFKRFTQESKDISAKAGGLGIGLSIVKENVNLLGGTINLESEKGKGAKFIVSIPFEKTTTDDQYTSMNN